MLGVVAGLGWDTVLWKQDNGTNPIVQSACTLYHSFLLMRLGHGARAQERQMPDNMSKGAQQHADDANAGLSICSAPAPLSKHAQFEAQSSLHLDRNALDALFQDTEASESGVVAGKVLLAAGAYSAVLATSNTALLLKVLDSHAQHASDAVPAQSCAAQSHDAFASGSERSAALARLCSYGLDAHLSSVPCDIVQCACGGDHSILLLDNGAPSCTSAGAELRIHGSVCGMHAHGGVCTSVQIEWFWHCHGLSGASAGAVACQGCNLVSQCAAPQCEAVTAPLLVNALGGIQIAQVRDVRALRSAHSHRSGAADNSRHHCVALNVGSMHGIQ